MKDTIETNVIKPEIKFFENDSEQIILTNEVESILDGRISAINSLMDNNTGKGKSPDEKDALYATGQSLWKDYSLSLRDAKYNLHLNRPQWKFLTNLILSKLEYDVNTVFFAIELTDMLGSMSKIKYTDDKTLVAFPVNATEITYVYHIISKHKIKGLTNDAYLFAQILRRIGNISKVFNYYDTTAKSLAADVQDWVTSFEDGVTLESKGNLTINGKEQEVAEVKVVKPSKEKSE